MPDAVLSARSKFNTTRRHHGPDHPATLAAARELEAAKATRAVDDPAALAAAARIVRTALARQRLTLADLAGADGGAA